MKSHLVAESLITMSVKKRSQRDTATSIPCLANSSSNQRPAGARTDRRGGTKADCVTGSGAAAVRAALQLRCDMCECQHHPGPHLPARLRTDREFGDTAAIDLFVLADYAGNQLSFINILDLASTFGVVAMVPSKHPKVVSDHFFKHCITPLACRDG